MKKLKSNQTGLAHFLLAIVVLVVIASIGAMVFYKVKVVGPNVDIDHPPQFIQADFVDLSKIYSISKFRSAAGHDFSDGNETCRSMKHYFTPQRTVEGNTLVDRNGGIPPKPDSTHDIDIFSPVDGEIVNITAERTPIGEQIYIATEQPKGFIVRVFHVFKLAGIKTGVKVKAGQKIGVISTYSETDIAVQTDAFQYHLLSYFSVMPDRIFAKYQARGAKSRDDFIISKVYRDAHPVPCNQDDKSNQAFYYPAGYDHSQDVFHLSGYVEPDYSKAMQGQHNTTNTN